MAEVGVVRDRTGGAVVGEPGAGEPCGSPLCATWPNATFFGLGKVVSNKTVHRLKDLRPLAERILGLVVQGKAGMSTAALHAETACSGRERDRASAQARQFREPHPGLEEQLAATQQTQGARP